jgi:hypothetical protein
LHETPFEPLHARAWPLRRRSPRRISRRRLGFGADELKNRKTSQV